MRAAHIDAIPRAIARADDGFFHPSSEDELALLVRRARRDGRRLRVRGSAHSVPGAIFTHPTVARRAGGADFDVMLDRYRAVVFDDATGEVTVQAGCHLGVDPRDPTRTSTRRGSLLAQLDARGLALPDLGGVAHQTISGFLLTGSRGGTVAHAVEDAVVALRLVDGRGELHELRRGRDELFDAALCSMGLLGVISTITLRCGPRYDVIGREDITTENGAAFDAFADGEPGLEGFLRRIEYARLMWWPQRGVERIATWQARRMTPDDYDEITGPPHALRPKRYNALGDGLGDGWAGRAANTASQAAGGAFYDAVANAARAIRPFAAVSEAARQARARAADAFADRVLAPVLRQFVPLGAQEFWDAGDRALPMDEQMSEEHLPTEFTEIWVPLDRAGEVMRALRDHYRSGYAATGAFACELYAAKASRAWMHPGYGRDSLRVDLFWFGRNPSDPRAGYFVPFWRLLQPFGYRLHWGKHLPLDAALGADHLRAHTPRWDDFMAARARLDPDGVYLTGYWREALGAWT